MTDDSALNKQMSWQQQNYDGLLVEIDKLKALLRQQLSDQVRSGTNEEATVVLRRVTTQAAQGVPDSHVSSHTSSNKPVSATSPRRESVDDRKQTSVMLNNLCGLFGLSAFERQLVVLCAAMELDPDMPVLCMDLSQQPGASMALALRCFDGHCSAMADDAPLAYFQLLELKRDHHSFMRRSLVISDWALFYLTGAPILEPLLVTVMHPIKAMEPALPTPLKNAELLSQARHYMGDDRHSETVVQLISATHEDHRQVAALLAKHEGREMYELSLYSVPLRFDEQTALLRHIAREVISRQCLVLIDCQRLLADGELTVDRYGLSNWLDCLLRDLPTAILLCASEQIDLPQTKIHYQRLPALSADEQLQLWQHCLQDNNTEAVQPTLLELTTQYNLTSAQVRAIARSATIAHGAETADGTGPQHLQKQLWQHSREQSRQNLHGLAQVIAPQQLDWNDLILPENEKNRLQSIVSQARQRKQVYQQWGFARQVPYGLGICALFAGGSGTGKTMAARVIAGLLNLDLYQVDISGVVDKYIGETEKKLDRLFQAAENSGAVLLFDEADALFGKRGKVQDARDRYANTGVSFLLQRMERYAGLSILTTNMRSAMDAAFTRRLRFIVQFPFPSEQEREKIWRCMIPATAPTERIDFKKLARLVLAGGAIRNIVLQAAFIAAEAQQPITMQYLLEAVRHEYIKAEKTLDANLVKDW